MQHHSLNREAMEDSVVGLDDRWESAKAGIDSPESSGADEAKRIT